MDTELHNFIFVWISVVTALIYCRYISKLVPVRPKRLFFFLPMILLFLLLPLRLTTISLGSLTAFFVAWLCNFKLLLLAYGKGPLVPPPPSPPLSLPLFIAIALLPIKISPSTGSGASKNSSGDGLKSPVNYVAKCLLVVSFFPLYQRSDYVHEKVMLMAYSIHMYIGLEVALAAIGVVAGWLIGAAVEPRFDEPYLATSPQDFWGRRWNLMVTSILRSRAVITEGWRLPTEVSRLLTVGFVVVTGFWLFLPPLLRCDAVAKARRETIAIIEFVKGLWSILRFSHLT
ncbi:hypothetical protein NL676_007580 [Syzygium grande]|nr:hypothetical protein NL676_007580 [Syzygium grande]